MQELHSNGYEPYRIQAVCWHNLWPAVRTELGQEEWQGHRENREQRGPIVASDQGSHRGHHCNKIGLTGNPSSKVWVELHGHEPLPSVAGSKRLIYWTSESW
jgi:hypothetical protein